MIETEGGERSRGLANIPLHGVQAEAAVRDVRRADVFGRCQQVCHTAGDERSQGDLERSCPAANTDVFRARAVDVDRVPTNPY